MTQVLSDESIASKRWQALTVIASIQLLLMLDATVVNVALPQIKHQLGLTDGSLTWVVNAYLIVAGSLLLLGGKIGDAYGVLKTFQAGLLLFGVFSFVAAIAPNANILIVGRAGQGIGEALAASNGLAMVSLLFPSGPERGKAFGIWAALGGLGSIIGVLLSGVITEFLSWRWVFGMNVIAIVPLAIASWGLIPKMYEQVNNRLDLGNALTLALAVSACVLGIIGSGLEQQIIPRVGLLIIGFAGIALVLRNCKRSENGIIPSRLMTRSPRLTGYAIIAIQSGTAGALFYLGVLRLQGALGLTPLQAGLAWLPFCIGFFPGIFLSQAIGQSKGPRAAAVTGLVISAIGFALFSIGIVLSNYWLGMMPAMLITSIGFGCVAPIAQSLATAELSEADAGAGSGIAMTIQQLFQVGGVTLLVALAIGAAGEQAATITSSGFITAFAASAGIVTLGAIFVALGKDELLPTGEQKTD